MAALSQNVVRLAATLKSPSYLKKDVFCSVAGISREESNLDVVHTDFHTLVSFWLAVEYLQSHQARKTTSAGGSG